MDRAKVSVLIPCHNAERYIGETLESVFRQTWPHIEVVVVDDGSSDGSIREVGRFARPQLKLIEQSNAGAGAARNRAMAAASGAFIQFLDADDILGRDKIERQAVRLIDHPRCVASAEWGRFVGSTSETAFVPEPVWRDLDPVDWLAASRADGLGMLFPALWLVPREIVRAAGHWDETLSLGDDGEYFTRVVLASERVLFCPGARCHYRSGVPGSLSRQKSRASWQSQFRVTELCERHVREREDSDRVRRGFALSWQHLAHGCYPYDAEIAERALARARQLHSATIQPGGGAAFHVASLLFGWRIARRLQVASRRY